MENSKKYYKEIDTLKGFAIFLVVLAHAIILYPINLRENAYCAVLAKLLPSIHMPLFFAISGYCFSYRGNYKDFLKKKVNRLIIPYIIFNLIDMVPRQLFPSLVNRSANMLDSIKAILLEGGEYWFLYTLFIIFLIYPLIYKWQQKNYIRMIFVEVILLALAVIRIDTQLFTLIRVTYYLFFFNTGLMIKNLKSNIFDWKINNKFILTGATVLLTAFWIFLIYSSVKYINILASLVGITISLLLTHFKWFNSIFARFGKYSLQLYLLNGFLLVISRTLICKVSANPLIIITFNMLIDFFLSYIFIKYVCERSKFVKRIMGMV